MDPGRRRGAHVKPPFRFACVTSQVLAPTIPSVTGRRCLVTGGLGFIGSNLALALARGGADVTVVDAGYPRHGANPANLDSPDGAGIRRLRADLSDPAVRPLLEGVEIVFNLAGQVSHVDSMSDPVFDLDVNTRSQVAFLEALRWASPAATVVYTSTRQLFGRPQYLPVDEEHPVSPVDVNGITKHAAEQFHLLYRERYGLGATVVRLTNVFGPRQRLRDDFQGFLPIFVRHALLGQPISLFGDGSQERDCLYVDDVVDCLVRAAITPDAAGEIFTVGNDEHLSLRRIAELIVEAAGSGTVELVPWPPDRDAIDIGSYFGDSSKAKRMLGWTPEVTFAAGIARTVDFYRAHLERYL
ncbi:MAG: NAD-dependent epimerase/dehydratase family protein [Actinomycetes bacterium]